MKIDINCDLGEEVTFDKEKCRAIMKNISSANIACGFHAGNSYVISETIKLAIEYGVAIGAHPGYPDFTGFGRRDMKLSDDEIIADIIYQVGAIGLLAELYGGKLNHVKLHGALYNKASNDLMLSRLILESLSKLKKPPCIYVMANSIMYNEALKMGYPIKSEVFCDRNYTVDGKLVPRKESNSILTDIDYMIERAIKLINTGRIEGVEPELIADTLCIHGDSSHSIDIASKLYSRLYEAGIEVFYGD